MKNQSIFNYSEQIEMNPTWQALSSWIILFLILLSLLAQSACLTNRDPLAPIFPWNLSYFKNARSILLSLILVPSSLHIWFYRSLTGTHKTAKGMKTWSLEKVLVKVSSWHTTLWKGWFLVVFWSRRWTSSKQRCHNVVFPASLLRPKSNFVTTSWYRRRFSNQILTL